MDIKKIQADVIDVMRDNLIYWGSSDWKLFIGNDGYVTIDHNTTCYKPCCADRTPVALISMYDFSGDGWIVQNDDGELTLHPDDTIEDWFDFFSISQIEEWINDF